MSGCSGPSVRLGCLLVLTTLIGNTFLTGCAGLRSPYHARFQTTPSDEEVVPSWDVVLAVPVDSAVRVELLSGDEMRGRFRFADARTLILERDGDDHGVSRADILRVSVVRGSHIWRGFWIGSAIALLLGSFQFRGSDPQLEATPGNVLTYWGFWAGIGAGVGALNENRELIYEAEVAGATN